MPLVVADTVRDRPIAALVVVVVGTAAALSLVKGAFAALTRPGGSPQLGVSTYLLARAPNV
ncbi:MAG: hypothetical protein IIC71_08310 [Acidobacteria bacterium]|nr:hypothetical protein [Acidobacteriota bacterium]